MHKPSGKQPAIKGATVKYKQNHIKHDRQDGHQKGSGLIVFIRVCVQSAPSNLTDKGSYVGVQITLLFVGTNEIGVYKISVGMQCTKPHGTYKEF